MCVLVQNRLKISVLEPQIQLLTVSCRTFDIPHHLLQPPLPQPVEQPHLHSPKPNVLPLNILSFLHLNFTTHHLHLPGTVLFSFKTQLRHHLSCAAL